MMIDSRRQMLFHSNIVLLASLVGLVGYVRPYLSKGKVATHIFLVFLSRKLGQ